MNNASYIGYETEPLPGTTLATKIGGLPVGFDYERWPVCRICGERQKFVLQLNLMAPLKLMKSYQWAFVFACGDIDCEPFLEETGANAVVLNDEATANANMMDVAPSHVEPSVTERHLAFQPYTECEDDWHGAPELFIGIAPHAPDYYYDLLCQHCNGNTIVIAQVEYDGHACYITKCQAECCDAAAFFMW